jgi:hypothetical protein
MSAAAGSVWPFSDIAALVISRSENGDRVRWRFDMTLNAAVF